MAVSPAIGRIGIRICGFDRSQPSQRFPARIDRGRTRALLSVPIGAALWAEPTAFLAAEQADRDLQLDLFEHQRVKVDLIVLKDGEIKVSLPKFDLPGPVFELFGGGVEQVEVDLEREADLRQAPIA